jgi:hypothetical protein
VKNPNILPLVKDSPWLKDHTVDIFERYERLRSVLKSIEYDYGNLKEFARAHEYFGIHFDSFRNGWVYREWAPQAYNLFLMGDFNHWNRYSHPLKRDHRGDWEIFLPYHDYKDSFLHGSKVKVHVEGKNGALDRIPGPGKTWCRNLPGICRKYSSKDQSSRIQYHSDDGHYGTSLLWVFWLSCFQLFLSHLKIRDAGRIEIPRQ